MQVIEEVMIPIAIAPQTIPSRSTCAFYLCSRVLRSTHLYCPFLDAKEAMNQNDGLPLI